MTRATYLLQFTTVHVSHCVTDRGSWTEGGLMCVP
jgi:hypothetical protein